jgi:hypothetical protein
VYDVATPIQASITFGMKATPALKRSVSGSADISSFCSKGAAGRKVCRTAARAHTNTSSLPIRAAAASLSRVANIHLSIRTATAFGNTGLLVEVMLAFLSQRNGKRMGTRKGGSQNLDKGLVLQKHSDELDQPTLHKPPS